MKKTVHYLTMFFIVIIISSAYAVAGESQTSSQSQFYDENSREYFLTSMAGFGQTETTISVRLTHYLTVSEAQNALLLLLREAFAKGYGRKMVDASTFCTEYSTKNGFLYLSLSKSFMRMPNGKEARVDARFFEDMPRFQTTPDPDAIPDNQKTYRDGVICVDDGKCRLIWKGIKASVPQILYECTNQIMIPTVRKIIEGNGYTFTIEGWGTDKKGDYIAVSWREK